MSYTTPLPSGVSRPLAEDNEHNHVGLVIIVASVCLFLILVSLGMRLYAASTRKLILRDDCLFVLTVILAVAQISVVLSQAHFGWGKSAELLDPVNLSPTKKRAYESDLLFVIVLGLSKCCTVVLYQHLSSRVFHSMTYGMLGATVIWTLTSLLLLAIRCSHDPWEDIDHRCGGLLLRWVIITALDIVVEVAIFLYPVKLIWHLQLNRAKKVIVLALLSSRVILIPFSAVHLHYVQRQIKSFNPTLFGAYATVVEELHLAFSVLLLTVHSMKLFLATYEYDGEVAYTNDNSQSQSRLRSKSRKGFVRSTAVSDSQYDHMDKPILQDSEFKIMRSVQISVTQERIELQDHASSTGTTSL